MVLGAVVPTFLDLESMGYSGHMREVRGMILGAWLFEKAIIFDLFIACQDRRIVIVNLYDTFLCGRCYSLMLVYCPWPADFPQSRNPL